MRVTVGELTNETVMLGRMLDLKAKNKEEFTNTNPLRVLEWIENKASSRKLNPEAVIKAVLLDGSAYDVFGQVIFLFTMVDQNGEERIVNPMTVLNKVRTSRG